MCNCNNDSNYIGANEDTYLLGVTSGYIGEEESYDGDDEDGDFQGYIGDEDFFGKKNKAKRQAKKAKRKAKRTVKKAARKAKGGSLFKRVLKVATNPLTAPIRTTRALIKTKGGMGKKLKAVGKASSPLAGLKAKKKKPAAPSPEAALEDTLNMSTPLSANGAPVSPEFAAPEPMDYGTDEGGYEEEIAVEEEVYDTEIPEEEATGEEEVYEEGTEGEGEYAEEYAEEEFFGKTPEAKKKNTKVLLISLAAIVIAIIITVFLTKKYKK